MAAIKDKRDYIEYHVNYLSEKYGLEQLRFDRKHNLLYKQHKEGYRENLIFGIKEIISYIDGIYAGFKIKENNF